MYKSNTINSHTYSSTDPELAEYSNWGSRVDIIAPGGSGNDSATPAHENLSTTPSTVTGSRTIAAGYSYMRGTSMACPVAAGVAALIFSANPSLLSDSSTAAAAAVKEKLLASTDGKTYNFYATDETRTVTTGCIDAQKAVTGAATASPFKIKRKGGNILVSNSTAYIGIGKKEQFQLIGTDGKKLKKAVTKGATWTIEGNSGITVKNGKITVPKSTAAFTDTYLTVTLNDSSLKVKLIPINKIKKIGYINSKRKFVKKYKTNATINQSINISDLDTIVGSSVLCMTKNSATTEKYYIGRIGYGIKTNKKTASMINGTMFTPTKKGSYKINYVLNDGSGKSFRVIFKVR